MRRADKAEKWGICEHCKKENKLYGHRVRGVWKWLCRKCWRV